MARERSSNAPIQKMNSVCGSGWPGKGSPQTDFSPLKAFLKMNERERGRGVTERW